MERTMAALEPGESGAVREVADAGPLGRRLLELGLIPGVQVECVGRAPLRDPSAYLVAGAVIALRRRDAAAVLLDGPAREAE